MYTGNRHVDTRQAFISKRNEFVINKNIDLLLFGDSITEGFDINRYYPTNMTILNSGIGGERLDTAYARIKSDCINLKPKKVLFNLGINDFIHNEEDPLNSYEQRIDELFKLHTSLLKQITANEIEVVVSSIIMLGELDYDIEKNKLRNFPYQNMHIKLLNKKIYDYCKENNILYIDYNKVLCNEYGYLKGSYTYDKIHLNEKGYFEIIKLLIDKGVIL